MDNLKSAFAAFLRWSWFGLLVILAFGYLAAGLSNPPQKRVALKAERDYDDDYDQRPVQRRRRRDEDDGYQVDSDWKTRKKKDPQVRYDSAGRPLDDDEYDDEYDDDYDHEANWEDEDDYDDQDHGGPSRRRRKQHPNGPHIDSNWSSKQNQDPDVRYSSGEGRPRNQDQEYY